MRAHTTIPMPQALPAGAEIAKPLTRILLTWVAEAGLRPLNFHPQRKQWEKRQFRSCAVMVLKIIENF
jgi:hypothetical protein